MTKAYAVYLVIMAALLGAGATSMFGITFADLADAPDSVYLGLYKVWLYFGEVVPMILALFFTLAFGLCGICLFMGFGHSPLSIASGFVFGVASWFILLGPICLVPDNMFITPGQKTVFVFVFTVWVYLFLAQIGHRIFAATE